MSVSVTDAVEEMLPRIMEIERACFSVPWPEHMLRAQLSGEHIFLAAVTAAGEVAGYVGLNYVLDEGYISNVAVAPEHRRRGVGGALVAALTERGRERKLAFLTLEVRESNAPAIALYEKHGFKVVGRRKGYYEKPREDAILMTLELDCKCES